MLIGHLLISFDNISVKDFDLFKNWVFCSLIVEFNMLIFTKNCSLKG